ncbi:MAG: hypothetical protein WA814_13865 [Candidatus Baltobacteraceae bacterium]
MFDTLTTRPDPIAYFIAVFPLSLVALAVGYFYAARYGRAKDDKAGWAFGLGQAAIFALIALILGFSFSFAAGRFEARRALVVVEADAIRTAYLRAGFLPPAKTARFRNLLIEYTKTRLDAYAEVGDIRAERLSIAEGKGFQGQLWAMAASAARRDPRSPFYADVTRSVIDVINVSDEQLAALTNHVPRTIIGIILLCTIVGALLLGLTFGHARAPNGLLSTIFCLLFAATVFTIIDLDHPQGGLIGVDVLPLADTLSDMTNAPATKLIRAHTSVLERAEPVPTH